MKSIKEMRKEASMSQTEFAALIGVPRSTLSQWETGRPFLQWLSPMLEHYVEYRMSGGEAAEPNGDNPLRSLVLDTGLSQNRFSQITGIPKRTIEDWSRGAYAPFPWVYPILHAWLVHLELICANTDLHNDNNA